MALTGRLDDDEGSEQRCHAAQQTVSQCSVGNGGLKRGRRRIAGEVLEHTRVGYLEPDVRCCGFPFALVLRSCDL